MPNAITSIQSYLRLIRGQFWVKITVFSPNFRQKWPPFWIFIISLTFYAPNSGGISQGNDFIQRIFVGI
jgi:hypothetical protein